MHPSGAHTHPDGGSGIGAVVGIVVAGAVVASIAGPVIAAVTALIQLVLIIVAVLAGLALAAGLALVVWRVRRGPRPAPWAAPAAVRPGRAAVGVAGPVSPSRVGAPGGLHLHLHGASPQDIAAALAHLTAAAERPETAPAAAVTARPGKRGGESFRGLPGPGGRR
jgi:hypothetical protein